MDLEIVVVLLLLLEKEAMDYVVHFEMVTGHVDEKQVTGIDHHVDWQQNSDSDPGTETVLVVHVRPVVAIDYDSVLSATIIVRSVDCAVLATQTHGS